MCNIRAYRHAGCGHTAQKCLSTCRGTYASPHCPRVPRCVHPGPSLVIHVNKSCRACQHQAVCDAWTRKIDDLKEKRDSLQSLLQEMGCAEADAWGCDEDDGLSFGDIAGSADTPFVGDGATCPGDCGGWCLSKSCPSKPKPISKKQPPREELCCNWLDPPSLRNEQRRLSNEIQRLQGEAEKDMWETQPQLPTEPNGFRKLKRRRTGPKVDGKSPLRIVTSSEDLKTPPPLEHSSSADSNESFCSSASSDNASTISNISVPTPTDSPDRSPPRSPTDNVPSPTFAQLKGIKTSSTCPLTQLALAMAGKKENRRSAPPAISNKWVRGLKRMSLQEPKKIVADDGADDLLPAWNDA